MHVQLRDPLLHTGEHRPARVILGFQRGQQPPLPGANIIQGVLQRGPAGDPIVRRCHRRMVDLGGQQREPIRAKQPGVEETVDPSEQAPFRQQNPTRMLRVTFGEVSVVPWGLADVVQQRVRPAPRRP
ncbi:hypothetical protein [Protofrankia sp. BMG5.30]|uniref:hypothetical protein n=1 Tax=Protofrankia sp. BMG5.30 TaxID=1834514 RepID=UPI0009CF97DD|nr:hypothetical protein [Protofrankia sp. BMG5.30]ONH31818.1 hypothetical protein BL254_22510 [Protofrankia sp. BMG5.30]